MRRYGKERGRRRSEKNRGEEEKGSEESKRCVEGRKRREDSIRGVLRGGREGKRV